LLWRSTNRTLAVVGAVILLLALVNREWAEDIAGWDGFSPWWVVLAIGLVFLLGMARANYEAFRVADAKATKQDATEATLRQKEELVRLQEERIGELQKAYNVSQAQYKVFEGFYPEGG
jgi:hypothetical protein